MSGGEERTIPGAKGTHERPFGSVIATHLLMDSTAHLLVEYTPAPAGSVRGR
eukprot:COSAG04_NODE_2662_length_3767_cov_3.263063_3_plen_52_part_00